VDFRSGDTHTKKKVDFEEAVISAVNKVFQFNYTLLAVIFILDSACRDKYKILVLLLSRKKLNRSNSHAECVLFGIPTYQ